MIVPIAPKDKRAKLHKRPVSPKLAAGLVVFFVFAVAVYLLANFKRSARVESVTGGVPAASVTNAGEMSGRSNAPQMKLFASEDDFKSYLDDGKRAAEGGIFAAQKMAAANGAAAAAAGAKTSSAGKPAVKNQKIPVSDAFSRDDGLRYLSLGNSNNESGGNIVQLNGQNIYFSPENQFYSPPGAESGAPAGETRIFDAADPAAIVQTGAIPRDGNFLILKNTLAVFLNNSLSAYDVSDGQVPREVWRARISDGSRIIGAKSADSKLYLAIVTAIDPANPCPIKPLAMGDKPIIVDCASIHHPQSPAGADSIFTILEIDAAQGAVLKDISWAGGGENSAVLMADGAIYAAWPESRDQIAFFAEFLQDKCKSLLPNYLLEKAAKLPDSEISFAAKEFELRGLLSNWFASLSTEEQARISAEIINRLDDYMRGRYGDFEQTGIAKIDLGSFEFTAQTEVPGSLAGQEFINEYAGNLRVLTVSGAGAAQKMEWFVTGSIKPQDSQKILNNAYLFAAGLSLAGSAQTMNLPAGICAARFAAGVAYVSTCRASDPLYVIGVDTSAVGLRGAINAAMPAFIYPFGDGSLLAVSQDKRKIKIALFDMALPAKPQSLFEYSLNDYWADLDGNYSAFAADSQNKIFFLSAARGGYVFSYQDGKVVLKGAVGEMTPSRAFFRDGNLYLAGDGGIEIYGADLIKIKSIKF